MCDVGIDVNIRTTVDHRKGSMARTLDGLFSVDEPYAGWTSTQARHESVSSVNVAVSA